MMPLASIGSVSTTNMPLSNVYYIPSLTSFSKLCDYGYSLTFSSNSCCVQDSHSGGLLGQVVDKGDFMFFEKLKFLDVAASISTSTIDFLAYFRLNSLSSSLCLWHSHL